MLRAILIAAAALPLLGAAAAPAVEYRVAVEPAGLAVEMRLRGEADGDTRLAFPANLASDLAVSGGAVEIAGPTERLVRHKPGARLRVRYRAHGGPGEFAALGEALFVTPQGWDALPATVTWRLPKGWRVASDLDHAAEGRALTVQDVRRSVVLAGPALQTAERSTAGGVVRAAALAADRQGAEALADAAAPAVAALRAYLGEPAAPFFVARVAAADRVLDLDDGAVAPATGLSAASLRRAFVEAHMADLVTRRMGGAPTRPAVWLTGGLPTLLAERALARAGLVSPDDAVGRLAELDAGRDAASRGAVLALKWDDEVRRKTGGKADLDNVALRMRDHYARFAPGQGPDLLTSLVSAVWVTAGLDIRPDIARYAETTAPIPLPDELFGGCILARVTVSPGFDAGFDTAASFAARTVKGVRRRGPAWNSGVRDGMRLDSWTLRAGDMTRQVELLVRTPKMSSKAKPRRIAYWPYGDSDVETRKIQFSPELSRDALAQCARRLGGL